MADPTALPEVLQQVFDDRFEVRPEAGGDGSSGARFFFAGRKVRSEGGILRFTPDVSYSTGNFSRLRERHATLQLDSLNGTGDRLRTILERTRWPREAFEGKVVLECGCGAGADTEVLLSLGATVVAVDLAGLEVCKRNLEDHPRFLPVQASIDDLPFKPHAFDIVWCHRVLQHTPDPEGVLRHILSFGKPEGRVFVHSYARSWSQMLSWKYALLPLTRRVDSARLYRWVSAWVPPLYRFTNFLRRIPPNLLGRILFKIAKHTLPIRNYRFEAAFADKDDAYLLEYAVHDTFDALSPRYDSPLSARRFRAVAEAAGLETPWEVHEDPWITLLRSLSSG